MKIQRNMLVRCGYAAALCFAILAALLSSCGKGGGIRPATPVNSETAPQPARVSTALGEFLFYRTDGYGELKSPAVSIEASSSGNAVLIEIRLGEEIETACYFRAVCPKGVVFENAKPDSGGKSSLFLAVETESGVDFGAAIIGGGSFDAGSKFATLKFRQGVPSDKVRRRLPPEGQTGRVNNLTFDEISESLGWSYRNPGDYDQNGDVGIADITPIALNYLKSVGANPHFEAMDGSGNGEIGIEDITPIALNYLREVAGYSVRRSPFGGGVSSEAGFVPMQDNGKDAAGRIRFSFSLTGLPDGSYSVVPKDSAGNADAASNAVGVDRSIPLPPGAPTGLNVTSVTDKSVTLFWGNMPEGGEEFRLYVSASEDMAEKVLVTPPGQTALTFTIADLEPENDYYFHLTAANVAGESEPSETVTATTLPLIVTFDYEWLFMVYIGADNNLAQAGLDDIDELEAIGSTDSVAIAVQAEIFESWGGPPTQLPQVHRFKVVQNSATGTFDASAYPGNMTFPQAGYDSSDPANIADFVNWAKSEFNAKRTCLVLWDHGSSWEPGTERSPSWIISDDTELTSGDNYLIAQALGKDALDVLCFDGCIMGGAEVMDAFSENARWIVASEQLVPFDGFPYTEQMQWLTANPSASAEELSDKLAEIYTSYYAAENQFSITMSVFDTTKYAALKGAITEFAAAFDPMPDEEKSKLAIAALTAESYEPGGIDILHFLEIYGEQSPGAPFAAAAAALSQAVSAAVPYSYAFDSPNDWWARAEFATGISIWIPEPLEYEWLGADYGTICSLKKPGGWDLSSAFSRLSRPTATADTVST